MKKVYMRRIIAGILAIVLVFLLVFAVRMLRRHRAFQLLSEAQDLAGSVDPETSDGTEDLDIDFASLQEMNEDIYAWIFIPGTNVSYPILQSSDASNDDYYLMHNLDGTYGYPGNIYTQQRNAKDFTDRNTVIYGHNMRNGSMFQSLHWYEEDGFLSEHPYVYIYTENEKLVYEIFAVYTTDNRLLLDYYGDFENIEVYAEYLAEVYAQYGESDAIINPSVVADASDRIITLSTCLGVETERFVVQAKLIEEYEQ